MIVAGDGGSSSAELWADVEPCGEHGFHLEDGFQVDGEVAAIRVAVVKCHSKRNPTPKERLVVITPDGKARIHDYAMIARVEGRQIVGDKWAFGQATAERVARLASRLFVALLDREKAVLLRLLSRFIRL